jgi:hypothetical protein
MATRGHGEPPRQASSVLRVQALDIDNYKPLFTCGLVSTVTNTGVIENTLIDSVTQDTHTARVRYTSMSYIITYLVFKISNLGLYSFLAHCLHILCQSAVCDKVMEQKSFWKSLYLFGYQKIQQMLRNLKVRFRVYKSLSAGSGLGLNILSLCTHIQLL